VDICGQLGQRATARFAPRKTIWHNIQGTFPIRENLARFTLKSILGLAAAFVVAISPLTQAKTITIAAGRPAVSSVAVSVKSSEAMSPQNIQQYVATIANQYGVNAIDAEFIISHESQDCQHMSGDDGISIGCWMFNLKAHPEVSRSCAMDLSCSTNLAMQWILAGRINAWSTWRFRCKMYTDAPDCD
jgi:hypothetical protein